MAFYGGEGGPSGNYFPGVSTSNSSNNLQKSGTTSVLPANGSSYGLGDLFNFLGAAGTLYGTYKSVQIQKEMAQEYTQASRLASKINSDTRAEQQAVNSQQAANERRQQIREERVRRGKIIQASQNTGVSESSGSIGAQGGISNQFATNVGNNLGMLQATGNISANEQLSANIMGEANNSLRSGQADASLWSGIAGLSQNIFAGTGGFTNLLPKTNKEQKTTG